MIIEEIFNNVVECRAQIEADFQVDLSENLRNVTVLMRGENSEYERTESTMKRFLTEEDGRTMKPINYVSPFIDFEDIYAEFHSERHNLAATEGAGFLQHYGFPTDLLDLSPCFNTARFFAAYGMADQEIGMIGAFDANDMRAHFAITDLSTHPFAQRPRAQRAFAARPESGVFNLKDPACDDLFHSRWYKVRKSADDSAFASRYESHVYPTEEEIAYFFTRDLDGFLRDHWAYSKMSEQQRLMLHERIEIIRGQLKARPAEAQKLEPLCG